jgi:plasmid maintenance system antidote protein VapI
MIKKLKQHMKKNNITATDMAALIGTTKFTFSRWINGKNEISQAYRSIINEVIK